MQDFENYKKEKLTIDLVWANVFGLLILIPIIIVFGLPYYLLWKPDLNIIKLLREIGLQGFLLRSAMYFGIFMGIVLHELIHGIAFARYAKNGFKSIKFGVMDHANTLLSLQGKPKCETIHNWCYFTRYHSGVFYLQLSQ